MRGGSNSPFVNAPLDVAEVSKCAKTGVNFPPETVVPPCAEFWLLAWRSLGKAWDDHANEANL